MAAPITVTPIAGALGAEIGGIDLGQPVEAGTIAAIRQALLDHLVIFFRDQEMTSEQYLAFAEAFGTPVEYPLIKGIEGFPTITEIVKHPHDRINFGGIWHSDTTYLDVPPMGTLLYALEVPPHGGDTMFTNQYLAYESLSEPMRKWLEGMSALSVSTKADVSRTREDMIVSVTGKTQSHDFSAEHPVVRTHPETGRRSLYINVAHTAHFAGMSEAESAPILRFLFDHQVKPEFTCRFAWRKGSLAFWDNRVTQHNPVNDYHGFLRVMRRITLAGDRPR